MVASGELIRFCWLATSQSDLGRGTLIEGFLTFISFARRHGCGHFLNY